MTGAAVELVGALTVGVVVGLYAYGTTHMHRRQPAWRPVAFAVGAGAGVVAVWGPLEASVATSLTAHMVQHLVLLIACPALVVAGRPAAVIRAGLARVTPGFARTEGAAVPRLLRRAGRNPVIVWVLATLGLWAWHFPAIYEAALSQPLLHAAEHATFVVGGLAFWSLVLGRRRLGDAPAIGLVVAVALPGAALGAMLTFAGTPIYPSHPSLVDQHVAGGLMWIPPGLVYAATVVTLLARWLRSLDRRVPAATVGALFVLGLVASACSYGSSTSAPYRPPGIAEDDDRSGHELYLRDCAWCHGSEGEGTRFGPDLVSDTNGPALWDFMLRTGRMPIDDPAIRPVHEEPAYPQAQIDAIVEHMRSFDAPGPDIPDVDLAQADLSHGAELYQDNCAACHSTTGIGGTLTETVGEGAERPPSGLVAPSLDTSTPVEMAEAMRAGPGTMPVFSEEGFSDADVDAIARYVVHLQTAPHPGGASIGRIGPVAEGAVALIVGLGLLLVFTRWIGSGT